MAKPSIDLTEKQRAALEAIQLLTARLGRVPSPPEVGAQLGVKRTAARSLMLHLHRHGLIRQPVVTYAGDWGLTAAGKKVLRSS